MLIRGAAGALRRADVGVALCDVGAGRAAAGGGGGGSVAAVFTSRVLHIGCVEGVLREGRCALVTSFSLFKYMAAYSMLQFFAVLILYYVRAHYIYFYRIT